MPLEERRLFLEKQDKERVLRIIDFLKSEVSDCQMKFLNIDFKKYSQDSDVRISLERCVENIVNASLDITKIILVDENLSIPETYREYFIRLFEAKLLDQETAGLLAQNVKLRNILVHQYVDTRWKSIHDFLSAGWNVYQKFLESINSYLKNH